MMRWTGGNLTIVGLAVVATVVILLATSACETGTAALNSRQRPAVSSPLVPTVESAQVALFLTQAAVEGQASVAEATANAARATAETYAARVTAQARAQATAQAQSAQATATERAYHATATAQSIHATATARAESAQATATERAYQVTSTAEAIAAQEQATARAASATCTAWAGARTAEAVYVTQTVTALNLERQQHVARVERVLDVVRPIAWTMMGLAALVLALWGVYRLVQVAELRGRQLPRDEQGRTGALVVPLPGGGCDIVHVDRLPGAVVHLLPDGNAEAPPLGATEAQERTTTREQWIEVERARASASGVSRRKPRAQFPMPPRLPVGRVVTLRRLDQALHVDLLSPPMVEALETDWRTTE